MAKNVDTNPIEVLILTLDHENKGYSSCIQIY